MAPDGDQEPAFFQNTLSICKEPELRRIHWVIKLGGSLFDLKGFPQKLLHLVDQLPHEGTTWIVPGGGKFAEEVRRLDAIHQWPLTHSHRLAMQTMSLSARMLAAQHDRFQMVSTLNDEGNTDAVNHELQAINIPRINSTKPILVVDVTQLDGIDSLPCTWDLTSDSIAAWVAQQLPEAHLVLAKSVALPETSLPLELASSQGLVDRLFPEYARKVMQISWVNLRDKFSELQLWKPTDWAKAL